MEFGNYKLNFVIWEMIVGDIFLILISGEFVVLKFLVIYFCELLLWDKLMNLVCGCDYSVLECSIDV